MVIGRKILPVIVLSVLAASAGARNEVFEISSKVSCNKVLPGKDFSVAFIFEVPEKHYLYRNDFALSFEGVSVREILISKPKTKFDPFLEKELEIYDGGCIILADLKAPESIEDKLRFSAVLKYRGCSDKVCFLLETKRISFEIPLAPEPEEVTLLDGKLFSERENLVPFGKKALAAPQGRAKNESVDVAFQKEPAQAESAPLEKPALSLKEFKITGEENTLERIMREKGLFIAFLFVFASGFIVSFTPCVYPLIPITLSIIGAKRENVSVVRGFMLSVIYVLGISVTYGVLGALAASLGSAVSDALNSPVAKGAIAAVLIALALSMFGLYEIQVPSFLQTKLRAKKWGGLAGVFLMGMISGCIATPCIAPALAAALLYALKTGDAFVGFWLCFTFAWGMGILFVALGTATGLGKSLPAASEWMITVKKVFGFILLGAALYFLASVTGVRIFRFLFGSLLFIFGIFIGAFDRLREKEKFPKKTLKGVAVLITAFGAVFILSAFFLPADRPMLSWTPPEQAETAVGGRINWIKDPEVAFSRFEQGKGPMLIEFYQDICPVCEEMEADVLSKGPVVRESNRFINLKVDFAESASAYRSLKEKFGVFGTPTFVFIGRDGSALVRVGKVELNDFLDIMRNTR